MNPIFNTLTIRTAFTQPVTIDLNAPPNPTSDQIMRALRPDVLVQGPAGALNITSAGVHFEPSEELIALGTVSGIIAAWILYRAFLK